MATEKEQLMSRGRVAALRDAILKALRTVEEAHHVKISIETGSFDPEVGIYKAGVIVRDPLAERKEFERLCGLWRMPPDAYGMEGAIPARGGAKVRVALIGFVPKRSKFPIKTRAIDGPDAGKIQLWQESVLERCFGRKPEAMPARLVKAGEA